MAKITGRDRLRFVLTKLPKEMRTELRATILIEADGIADIQRRLAHSDRVRDGITVTPGDRDVARYNKLRSKRSVKDPELAAIISSDHFIAPLEEFGTSPHLNEGRFPGTQHPGTPPKPSFYPGWRAGRKRAQNKINKAARKAIKQGIK